MLKSKSTDTYLGTVSSQATRLLLSIIAEHDLDLRSFDVKTAFLYTRLNEFSEGIYMRRTKGFSDTEMPAIFRLLSTTLPNSLRLISRIHLRLWDSSVSFLILRYFALIKMVTSVFSARSLMMPWQRPRPFSISWKRNWKRHTTLPSRRILILTSVSNLLGIVHASN